MPVGVDDERALGKGMMVRVLDDKIRGRVAHPGDDRFVQRITADQMRRHVETVVAERFRQFLQQQVLFPRRLGIADQHLDGRSERTGQIGRLRNRRLIPMEGIHDD